MGEIKEKIDMEENISDVERVCCKKRGKCKVINTKSLWIPEEMLLWKSSYYKNGKPITFIIYIPTIQMLYKKWREGNVVQCLVILGWQIAESIKTKCNFQWEIWRKLKSTNMKIRLCLQNGSITKCYHIWSYLQLPCLWKNTKLFKQ